jgi:eukaryotic-like serine/threonine-protein kinase
VLKQLPEPNATVKVNRTVFLTVNRQVPPMIAMPKLQGQSLRFALDVLERNHLKLEDTIFKPDFMKGSVLDQQIAGVSIAENAKVQWGSKITLIIGSGLGGDQMIVPNITGMTFTEAKNYLNQNGIGISAIIAEGVVRDTANAYVVRQNPERYDEEKAPKYIQQGQVMDIWISSTNTVQKDSVENKKK